MEINRSDFLKAALEDIQETVRAFDWKAEVLLIGMSVPLLNVTGIISTLQQLLAKTSGLSYLTILTLSVICAVTWTSAFLLSLTVLLATKNPAKILLEEDRPKRWGFFTPALFKPSLCATILGRTAKSERSLSSHIDQLPRDEEDLVAQLAFEQMKVGFICARKMCLFNAAVRATIVGVVGGSVLWVVHIAV